ncbi:hypothetical protein E2C01_032336 [Portunus trituberculatus]|uniref:Uncharacterized protein n=1 Tax=Portunus trituberculatus TaxID=210409 RepID=A0A5B7EV23_PORTR|nr:hypothetical protein [Portunus trituberculatus]
MPVPAVSRVAPVCKDDGYTVLIYLSTHYTANQQVIQQLLQGTLKEATRTRSSSYSNLTRNPVGHQEMVIQLLQPSEESLRSPGKGHPAT